MGTGRIKTAGRPLEGRNISLIKKNGASGYFIQHVIYADAPEHWPIPGKVAENQAAPPPSWQ